jgi:hypothetical protein
VQLVQSTHAHISVQDKKRFPDGAVFMTWGKRPSDQQVDAWFREKVEDLASEMDSVTVLPSCFQRIADALTAPQQSLRQALRDYQAEDNSVCTHEPMSSTFLREAECSLFNRYQGNIKTFRPFVLKSCIGTSKAVVFRAFVFILKRKSCHRPDAD